MDLRGASILIVDDLPANLEILCESLEEAGYEVQVAADGQSALLINPLCSGASAGRA